MSDEKSSFNPFDSVAFTLEANWLHQQAIVKEILGPDVDPRLLYNLKLMYMTGFGDMFRLARQTGELPGILAVPILADIVRELNGYFMPSAIAARQAAAAQEAELRNMPPDQMNSDTIFH
jgi:hypothetical protein